MSGWGRGRLAALLALALACAHEMPRPEGEAHEGPGPTGPEIFAETLRAHGGDELASLHDVSLALEGDWPFLLPRVQPLLADVGYRVASEERLLPAAAVYAVDYHGPAGNKRVLRTRDEIRVRYDGVPSEDDDVLGSTALTADSYIYFLLGPFALAGHAESFVRLRDVREDGRRYLRVHAVLEPGVGLSARDEIVLWVDAETKRTFRVHFTIDGFRTTRGAHVDVTFLEYVERGGFVFPSRFHERVRAPIAIDAHTWWLTGLDLNRGLDVADLDDAGWSERAARPASPLEER